MRMKERKREREKFFTSLSSNKIEKIFFFFWPVFFFFFNLNMQEFGLVFELKSLDHVNALHKISHFRKTCAAFFFFFLFIANLIKQKRRRRRRSIILNNKMGSQWYCQLGVYLQERLQV